MRQISTRSKVALPSIYYHFENKEELFKAVEKECYSAHTKILLEELHSDTQPEARLHQFVLTLVKKLDSDSIYLKLLQRNLVEGWEDNQKFLVDQYLQGVYDELKQLLNECSPGLGEDINPIIIFSLILGYLTLQPVTRLLKGYKYAKTSSNNKHEVLANSVIHFIKNTNSKAMD